MKTIFSTFFTKALSAACSLAIVMLTTHFLGAAGRGEISLLSADIGMVLLFSQIVGGASLVYLYSRSNPFLLVLTSLAWAIAMPCLLIPLMYLLGWIEHGFSVHLVFLCITFGCASSLHMLILGAEKIQTYNILHLMLSVIILLGLCFFFFVLEQNNTEHYIVSLHLSYGLAFVFAIFCSWNLLPDKSLVDWMPVAKEALVRGITVQFSNIVQFFNYRLSYFFLSTHMASLGIFSVSLVLAEAVWLIGNSISLVHFSQVSNEKVREESIRQTFLYAKLSFWATFACVFVMAVCPASVYAFVFGKEFGASKIPTLIMCPGILAIGFGMIFSHYFAGTGRFGINNLAAICGLALKIPLCFLLIPMQMEIGAAWACSLSYLCSFLILYYNFRKETGFSFPDLAVSKNELLAVSEQIGGLFRHSPVKE